MRGWRFVRQCSRAWRTSERPCSLARSVFFDAVALANEPARDRGGQDLGAKGRQFSRKLRHGDVARLGDTPEQERAMRVELGGAPPALWLGGQAAGGPIGCHQPHHKSDRHLKMARSFMAGMPRLDKARHPAPQIQRGGLGHRSSPPKRARMSESRSRHAEKPTIQSELPLL